MLGKLPLGSLSYANVLKPLIDLDYVSQTKNSWMQVSIFEMENGNECYLIGEVVERSDA